MNSYIYPGIKSPEQLEEETIITERDFLSYLEEEFNVPFSKLVEKTRKKEICEVRHIYCYVMHKKFHNTHTNIGKLLGGRDHSTSIHSYRKFLNLYETESNYRQKSNIIFNKIRLHKPKIKTHGLLH
jgi:chromosomal replication initiation ATPase DnaA